MKSTASAFLVIDLGPSDGVFPARKHCVSNALAVAATICRRSNGPVVALTRRSGGNLDAARRIGKAIAERALEKGISSVVFDRGGYLYHGRIKALTDAAREAGLNKNELAARAEEESAKVEDNVAVKAEGKPRKKTKEKQ